VWWRCCRGVGYMDDKSVERLSVLFPRLTDVELRLCSVSDDGLLSLCRHNQRAGGLTRLTLDHAGHITDTALTSLADHCPALQHFTLARCPRITNSALRSAQLSLSLSLSVGLFVCVLSSPGATTQSFPGPMSYQATKPVQCLIIVFF